MPKRCDGERGAAEIGEQGTGVKDVGGQWEPAFAPLAERLASATQAGDELGCSFAVRQAGTLRFVGWAGWQDREKSVPWQEDTLCCCFSVTKALASLVVLNVVAEGHVGLEDPIARYWHDFAQAGKANITLRQVLSHQSGVVGCRTSLAVDDYLRSVGMATALAAEPPWWPPGTQHGYHARSFGLILDRLLQEATGQALDRWLARFVEHAYGVHLGLNAEADLARCTPLLPPRATAEELKALPEDTWEMLRAMADPRTPTGAAFLNPRLPRTYMNQRAFRTAMLPSSNAHATTAELVTTFAELYARLPSSLQRDAATVHAYGQDQVLLTQTAFGLGLMLKQPDQPAPLGPGTIGHVGSGGAVLFHQPEAELTVAFLGNRMRPGVMHWGPTAEALMAETMTLIR
ncbi:MAG: serine hydrolase domain-containing protein [Pseudomonadota bacterium]